MRELQAALPSFAKVLGEAAGLAFPRSRHGVLSRAVEQRMEASGSRSAQAYLELLADRRDERRALLELATVGETYFFRHTEQLDALQKEALAPLVAERRRRGDRSVRLWSAGCASGEEAYTMAILAAESAPDFAEWDLRVVGSDVSEGALRRARIGRYGAWSVRSDLKWRERWFVRDGTHRRVVDAVRNVVCFERHNLVVDLPSVPAALGGPPDVVLCRNVLMYLERNAVRRVIEGLFNALAPGGWLIVAPVEASIPGLRRFELFAGESATLYRRPGGTASHGRHRGWQKPAPTVRPTRTATPTLPHRVTSPSRPVSLPTERSIGLADVREMAERGQIEQARILCGNLVRSSPSVEGFLLLATLDEASDDLEAASAALRRACYLDAHHIGAQFRLGLVEWRRGAVRRSRSRLRRAVELAKSCADDDPIPAIELNAARLRSIAGTMIQ